MMSRLFNALPLVVLLVAAACGPSDPCADVDCGTQGSCSAGECTCNDGYAKDDGGKCNVEARARFLGMWTASDSCSQTGTTMYAVQVTASAEALKSVVIQGFWSTFVQPVTASIEGDTITVARQEPDMDEFFTEGSGVFTSTDIRWNFVVSDETDTTMIVVDSCASTWTK